MYSDVTQQTELTVDLVKAAPLHQLQGGGVNPHLCIDIVYTITNIFKIKLLPYNGTEQSNDYIVS